MAALEELYHRHKAEIWRYLNSLTRDPDEAEDLMQSVFIKLVPLVRKGTLKNDGVRAYLYRMAYSVYVDAYRRGGTEERVLEQLKRDAPASDTGRSGGAEIYEIIHRVLASGRLSERQASILKLRVLGHYGMQEIADSTEVALSTVHRELQSAFTELRSAFRAAGIEPADYQG